MIVRPALVLALSGAVLLAAACGGGVFNSEDERAKPEFCGWANEIAANVPPPPPPVDPELPLDVDRLVEISGNLSNFASTLESAAAFAPSRTQVAFTELASFNREVAAVITGSSSLRERFSDAAQDAADTVVETVARECGIRIDAQSTLAFFEG